jgi:hypothetical protein
MPMVRPTLASDLAKLEQEFVHGYTDGAFVFYVTTTNEEGKTQDVLEADKASWDPIWNAKNDAFNTFLLSDPNFVTTLASSPLLTWSFFRPSKGYER